MRHKEAHDRGVESLLTHGDSKRSDGMLLYNTWGHIFVTHALALEIQHCADEHLKLRLTEAARLQIKRLGQYETYVGGWNYYDFDGADRAADDGPDELRHRRRTGGPVEARRAGLEVPQKMIDHALHRLEDCRLPNGAFLYGSDYKYVPRLPANQPQGASGPGPALQLRPLAVERPKGGRSQGPGGAGIFFQGTRVHRDGPQAAVPARVVVSRPRRITTTTTTTTRPF